MSAAWSKCWESLPRLPEARDHVGGALITGTLYVLCDRDRGQAHVRGEVYALDLRNRWWSRNKQARHHSDLPTPNLCGTR
ncbi:hypothetical protein [Streptomyces gilvosporeus]|uniref:hypothetical protein n=1 Tax=Streptomyces gilvosporeus TaxID=553510 RepID=UPI00131BF2C2|nr:hypothetical protein [Streptomyces gilvosporeus]